MINSNHMIGSGDFWDKSLSQFLKILKLLSVYSRNFKIFKNALGQSVPNHSSKHVITRTNQFLIKFLIKFLTIINYFLNDN